ncbi:hypothetical protein MHTCC0001_09080 [Flavobacteriaceae bacterium MHTCC 0001]
MKNSKNNLKKVFLMVALIATVTGYANEDRFLISKNDVNGTVLTLTNVKVGNLFTIRGENGVIIYKESIQQDGDFVKDFDLTDLPDGKYFFELDKKVEISIIPFKVEGSQVTFNKELETTAFKPVTVVKDDMVYVTKLSLNKEPLDIEIYFENSTSNGFNKIYSETVSNEKNIERLFKLADINEGKYKIVYKSEGRMFVEFI